MTPTGLRDRAIILTAVLVGDAARKARELAGADARVCVVGDTPRAMPRRGRVAPG